MSNGTWAAVKVYIQRKTSRKRWGAMIQNAVSNCKENGVGELLFSRTIRNPNIDEDAWTLVVPSWPSRTGSQFGGEFTEKKNSRLNYTRSALTTPRCSVQQRCWLATPQASVLRSYEKSGLQAFRQKIQPFLGLTHGTESRAPR